MNSSSLPPSKQATLDLQVNGLTKLLFVLVTLASAAMVLIPLVQSWIMWGAPIFNQSLSQRLLQAALDFACFILLFSQIIPISLRVALDVAKLTYKLQMTSDRRLPGLQVRSSTLPEELGGIEYLLTDKTGTLTRNEMRFRKLHLGVVCLSEANIDDLQQTLKEVLGSHPLAAFAPPAPTYDAYQYAPPANATGAYRPHPPPACAARDTTRTASACLESPSERYTSGAPERYARCGFGDGGSAPGSVPGSAPPTPSAGEGAGGASPDRQWSSNPFAPGAAPGAAPGGAPPLSGRSPRTSGSSAPRQPDFGAAGGGGGGGDGVGTGGGGSEWWALPSGDGDGGSAAGPQGQAMVHALLAIALCHNVSPVDGAAPDPPAQQLPGTPSAAPADAAPTAGGTADTSFSAGGSSSTTTTFQGASPDELALVHFAARCVGSSMVDPFHLPLVTRGLGWVARGRCGITLVGRTPYAITLREPSGRLRVYEVRHASSLALNAAPSPYLAWRHVAWRHVASVARDALFSPHFPC